MGNEHSSEYAIEMLHITKRFPGIIANDDVTIQLRHGEIHALLGENGAGKSTLMSVLFGLYQPEEGKILKDGKEVTINDPNDANALGIGMVHQHFKLVECFTVLDNIILGVEPVGNLGFLRKKEAREKVLALSEKYGLQVDPDAKVEDITVGMQQRTEILKMLYRDNDILIFDEPTAVLTPQEITELMQIMKNLAAEGKSILFISHKLAEIMAVSDRCSVLRKGKYIGTVNTADVTMEDLSSMMVGRNVNFHVDKEPCHPGDVILEVSHMTVASKSHGNDAVKDVSFNVRAGEIVCIAGIDGNGQSELIDVLTGMVSNYTGEVKINGRAYKPHDGTRARREGGLGCIPEDRQLTGSATGGTILANFIMVGYRSRAFASRLFINYKKAKEICWQFIKQFTVKTDSIMNDAISLSGGNLQKLIVARELYLDPDVLIAAQPSRGVDIGATEYIHETLIDQRNKGKSVLLVSNELSEIMEVSDRVLVIYKGRFVGEVDPMNTSEEEIGLLMAGIVKEGHA